jgi:hypothetical protein
MAETPKPFRRYEAAEPAAAPVVTQTPESYLGPPIKHAESGARMKEGREVNQKVRAAALDALVKVAPDGLAEVIKAIPAELLLSAARTASWIIDLLPDSYTPERKATIAGALLLCGLDVLNPPEETVHGCGQP